MKIYYLGSYIYCIEGQPNLVWFNPLLMVDVKPSLEKHKNCVWKTNLSVQQLSDFCNAPFIREVSLVDKETYTLALYKHEKGLFEHRYGLEEDFSGWSPYTD